MSGAASRERSSSASSEKSVWNVSRSISPHTAASHASSPIRPSALRARETRPTSPVAASQNRSEPSREAARGLYALREPRASGQPNSTPPTNARAVVLPASLGPYTTLRPGFEGPERPVDKAPERRHMRSLKVYARMAFHLRIRRHASAFRLHQAARRINARLRGRFSSSNVEPHASPS